MKLLILPYLLIFTICIHADEVIQIPAQPPMVQFSESAKKSQIILVYSILKENNTAKYKFLEVIHGHQDYENYKETIDKNIPEKPSAANLTYAHEIFFISLGGNPSSVLKINSIPIHNCRKETIGSTTYNYNCHTLKDVIKNIKDSFNDVK
jgi:uncharacterized short protein YbdD (DUF466 family)